jgi:N6-L-threonylcarbamoyladenine synthase
MQALSLSAQHQLPLVRVHHMEAHALVARMNPDVSARPAFPFLCLLVSGGHNLLVLARGVGDYVQLGTTLDDALGRRPFAFRVAMLPRRLMQHHVRLQYLIWHASMQPLLAPGEAYDKIARMLDLDMRPSGGAALEALARGGDPHAFKWVLPVMITVYLVPQCSVYACICLHDWSQ